jgi:hypothetical protein
LLDERGWVAIGLMVSQFGQIAIGERVEVARAFLAAGAREGFSKIRARVGVIRPLSGQRRCAAMVKGRRN